MSAGHAITWLYIKILYTGQIHTSTTFYGNLALKSDVFRIPHLIPCQPGESLGLSLAMQLLLDLLDLLDLLNSVDGFFSAIWEPVPYVPEGPRPVSLFGACLDLFGVFEACCLSHLTGASPSHASNKASLETSPGWCCS